jgi:hypothetical protein
MTPPMTNKMMAANPDHAQNTSVFRNSSSSSFALIIKRFSLGMFLCRYVILGPDKYIMHSKRLVRPNQKAGR